ncbi:hypothetical protein ABIE24_001967 [Mycetocola sp. 2940]
MPFRSRKSIAIRPLGAICATGSAEPTAVPVGEPEREGAATADAAVGQSASGGFASPSVSASAGSLPSATMRLSESTWTILGTNDRASSVVIWP